MFAVLTTLTVETAATHTIKVVSLPTPAAGSLYATLVGLLLLLYLGVRVHIYYCTLMCWRAYAFTSFTIAGSQTYHCHRAVPCKRTNITIHVALTEASDFNTVRYLGKSVVVVRLPMVAKFDCQ